MNTVTTAKSVQSAINAYAKSEGNVLAFIVKHGAESNAVAVTGLEPLWIKSVAPLYREAFIKSGRYKDANVLAVMVSRAKAIWLAGASGVNVNTSASWAGEAKRVQALLLTAGTVKATKRGTKAKVVTAGKATNTKAAVNAEAANANAKSRRQQVKVFTPAQLLEAAFIVTGNNDLAALLVKATLGHREQLGKALRAICAD